MTSPLDCCRDHTGKISQARVAAIVSAATACAIAAAPLWDGPVPSMEIVLVLLGGPGALALWQKLAAPQERPHEPEDH